MKLEKKEISENKIKEQMQFLKDNFRESLFLDNKKSECDQIIGKIIKEVEKVSISKKDRIYMSENV